MFQAATPFKIHDENDYSSTTLKSGKMKGFKSSTKPVIGGKISFENTPTGVSKTTTGFSKQRRALSNLSTSQVNARLNNTPGPAILTGKSIRLGENNIKQDKEQQTRKHTHESKVSFAEDVEVDKGYIPSLVSGLVNLCSCT
jgi:hypothetical protein